MRILFLSALDFKQKSIQVIRKTPEAYALRGWQVKCIVGRDTGAQGDYSYEPTITPAGVDVERFDWPLRRLRDHSRGVVHKLWLKLATLAVTLMLARRGLREIRRNGACDIVYGYEMHGTLAAALVRGALRLSRRRGRTQFVSRFQGTKLSEAARCGNWLKLLANADFLAAYWLPFDACIMTNDGTQGRRLLKWVRTRNRNVLYYVNGTDFPNPDHARQPDWQTMGIAPRDIVLLSVSRLVGWKRLDRSLRAVVRILKTAPSVEQRQSIRLVVAGEGSFRPHYEALANDLGLGGHVVFVGAVKHQELTAYYERANAFFSFYDLSNVGNPLLEAVRHHKTIFTIRGGDTHQWIHHRENGLIFEADDQLLPDRVATAFWELQASPELQERIARGVRQLEQRKLWTWHERMNAEVDAVEALRAA